MIQQIQAVNSQRPPYFFPVLPQLVEFIQSAHAAEEEHTQPEDHTFRLAGGFSRVFLSLRKRKQREPRSSKPEAGTETVSREWELRHSAEEGKADRDFVRLTCEADAVRARASEF